jgi:hypothetical protein
MSGASDMNGGRAWLAALPDELAAQRRVMDRLLGFCEVTPQVASFVVGCSLGRGAADALSDIDAAIGVAGDAEVRVVEQLVADALPGIGRLVDVLRYATSSDDGIRRVFAQFADRAQLDLAVVPQAGIRLATRPDFISLYHVAGPSGAGDPASAYAVTGEQVREWAFHGWTGLLDADKYLSRGSLWEAHERLHQVRHRIWALWAAARGALYPWHGLSQVLDRDPGDLPPGIGATVAVLDADDLRRAARASATLLATVSEAAAREIPADLPTAMAGYAISVLGA